MSRVTPPVTKLSHAVRSLTSASRQSGLRDPSRHALPLSSAELSGSSKHESSSSSYHTQTHALHRPTPPGSIATIPLMQGFRTTAKSTPSAPSTRTIDFITLPTPPPAPAANPFSRIRVPLLPDMHVTLSRSDLEPAEETAPARAEIHVVDIDTASARVAALSEVVGNEAEERAWGREFEELQQRFAAKGEEKEKGMLGELWSGIVEDVFGKDVGGGVTGKKLAV